MRQNVVAFTALFFALGGGAMAANSYIKTSDTISEGDLAGSTYGKPVIASGAVTNGKLANSSLTVSPGTGLTGGGSVSLGASTTLGVADGGIGTTQLHDGSVTTGKFDSNAQAPDAAKLDGASPSDYGAVLSGRINGLGTLNNEVDFGAVSGTSTATIFNANVNTLSPGHAVKARDFSCQLTAAPGLNTHRAFFLYVNGTKTPQTPVCFIGGLYTTDTNSNTVADIPADSTISIREDVTGNPASADLRFGFRMTNS
jgi:hypothetical protein